MANSFSVKKKFWSEGIQFQCQGSGNCCVSRGGYGYVYVTKADRKAMAKQLGISATAFTQKYCDQEGGIWKLKNGPSDDCLFLNDKKCSIYLGRPTQCRTWPFWPEVMNAKVWRQEVAKFCPGVGKGKTWSAAEVEKQLNDQQASEDQYGT
ncbi:MAG: YkgJ family cysteine cluster protein [Bdellovibrionaceae bacterium]|nr:YkgJ family cysteine cluster protein [Pseudobdellovibrionaceae bacterium]